MSLKTENDVILYSNMRTMISLIDRLRDFNLHEYISLPRITVLGDQSAGKSSILESVVGMNFLPRGSGIVTRRPLELRLVRESVAVPYFIFPKDFPNQRFTSQEEVRKKIDELTDKIAGVDKFISDVPIVLSVYSSTVPDLSLVDLPGITRVPTGKQPMNIEQITKGLISKYCSEPNSLILCVIAANIDITTSDALLFARQLDPTGSRTLGVLTKIDLMDDGVDCKKVLLNQEIPLQYGYVGVKGRSQKEITQNKSVSDAINAELNFFARHPVYSTLPSDLLGTRSLIDKVSKILFDMIKTALPTIKHEIVTRKLKAKEQIEQMGEDMPETDEKKQEMVFRLVRSFKENFDQEITGKFYHESLSAKNRRDRMKRTGETITFQLNSLFASLYEDFMSKDFKVTQDYTDEYIKNAMEVYQGDSMPGFQSFDSFLYLINPKMRLLNDPVYTLVEDAKNILEVKGCEILDAVFKKYPKLLGEVKDNFLRELSSTRNSARKLVENMMRCNENYWFTNDPYMVEGGIVGVGNKQQLRGKDLMSIELRSRIEKYFYIVVRNIRNTIPKIIGTFLLRRLSEKLEVSILNSLSRKNYMIDVFDETSAAATARKKLKAELTSLTNAENLLINEFGMGFTITSETVSERRVDPSLTASLGGQAGTSELEALQDIESMNDDFLLFNQRILMQNKGGQVAPVVNQQFTRLPPPTTQVYPPPAQSRPQTATPAQGPSYNANMNVPQSGPQGSMDTGRGPQNAVNPNQNRRVDPNIGPNDGAFTRPGMNNPVAPNPTQYNTQTVKPVTPQPQPDPRAQPNPQNAYRVDPNFGFDKPQPNTQTQPQRPAPTAPVRDPWDVPLVNNTMNNQPNRNVPNPTAFATQTAPQRPNATINLNNPSGNPTTRPPNNPAQPPRRQNNLFGDGV